MSLPPGGSPRILLVTPEIAYLPPGIAANAHPISIGTGPLAEKAASLVETLFQNGVDVHVALPDFHRLFRTRCRVTRAGEPRHRPTVCEERVHLAQDRHLFYWKVQGSRPITDAIPIALAFQREVINHIVPVVQPDLIHCMGWMTGLVPAMARERHIACLFSVQNFDTGKACLNTIEDRGIDAAVFWKDLYYERYPSDYETTRESIPVDFLASGILASDCVSVDSPVSLRDIAAGRAAFLDDGLRRVLIQKWEAGNAIDTGCPTVSLLRAAHRGDGLRFDAAHPEELTGNRHPTRAFYPILVKANHRQMHRIMTKSTLAARHHAAPDRYLKRYGEMLQQPEWAADLVQQAFMKKFQNWEAAQ